jgi:hypothetical protein
MNFLTGGGDDPRQTRQRRDRVAGSPRRRVSPRRQGEAMQFPSANPRTAHSMGKESYRVNSLYP